MRSYHHATTITLGPARPSGGPNANRWTRTTADPRTRLERLECRVAARNHTIKLRFGLSFAETLRLGPGLGFHGQLCLGKGQCNDF